VFTPLGVLTFQGTIKSTCTIYHGVASAIFTGTLPYFFLVLLLNWQKLQVLQWDCVNPLGKTGTQIPQLPLGDNSPPWGDNAVCM
jgi:hypothetical protein